MTVAIRKVRVPRHHAKVDAGQSVQAEIEIVYGDIAPVLTDPIMAPFISIYDPDDVQIVTDASMTRIQTGIYKYVHQTVYNSTVGQYTASFTATHLNEDARLERVGLFTLLRQSAFVELTYLAIKDQSNNVWYWYLTIDNTINTLPAVPVVAGKQSVAVVTSVIPYWLQLTNPSGDTWYVYPSLDGTATLTSTVLPVGTGYLGSPTFVAESGGSFQLTVNIANELDYIEV